jgi:uridine kinase
VKPAFLKYVEPQRHVADIVVPRGMQNKVAIAMIVNQTRHLLKDKSHRHNAELARLGKQVEEVPLSAKVILMEKTPQLRGIATILRNLTAPQEDFVFYMDRLTCMLVEKALDCHKFNPVKVKTPHNYTYSGLESSGTVSAVVILRGGSCMETGLKRTVPDCLTGRMLIQSNFRTGEPELHYLKLFHDISTYEMVLLLDPQMSSGGAALMAVKVLIDHGVAEEKIIFVTCLAGKMGANRLMSVFPEMKLVAANIVDDKEKRWIEERYLGC